MAVKPRVTWHLPTMAGAVLSTFLWAARTVSLFAVEASVLSLALM